MSAAPKEWNILDTTSLTYSDIQNYAEYKASSSSVGVSSSSLSNNITRNLLSQAPQALNGGEEATSTTYATLSPSNVTIAGATATDEQLKGLKTAQIDSRIIPIFDKQEVLDDMALASTVSDIVTLGSSVIATELKRDDYINRDTAIAQAEADLWVDSYLYGDGSAYEAYAQNPNVTALLSNEYLNSLYISDEDKKVFRSMLPQDQAQLLQDMVNKGESFGALSSQEASWHTTQLNYGPGSSFDMATQAIRGAASALAMGNTDQALANLTQPYIANQIGQYFDDPNNTNEAARALSHAALGAAVAYLSGNDATSGAAGAVTGEVIAQLAIKELYGDKDPNELTLEEKENVRAIATLASGLVGAASGRSFEDSATAAAVGYNAAVNNVEHWLTPTQGFNGDVNNYNQNIMWNEYNSDQTINNIRTYHAADEGAGFFGDLSLHTLPIKQISIPLGTISLIFIGIKHYSAYELGVLNPPQALVDFGCVGYGVKPLGSVAENAANEGAGWLMEQGNQNNIYYTIPTEEQTEAYRVYMEYIRNQNNGGRR